MKLIKYIIVLNFLFGTHYYIGDSMSIEDQNKEFNICYGDYPNETFKFADWSLWHTIYFGVLNMVEFGLWCGPSLAILCGVQLYRICKRLPPRGNVDTIVLALGVVMVGLTLFGHTAGETARLWIFLIPFVCFSGARCLATMKADSTLPVSAVITLQLGTVMIIKSFQDFF